MASKLTSLISNALRSSSALSRSSSIRFPPPRNLSTVAETPQPQVQTPAAGVPNPADTTILKKPSTGSIFAKLTGSGKNKLKTDVTSFFEDCKLTPEDIKVEYDRFYNPIGMILQFPSRSEYDCANKDVVRKGGYRLEKVDRSQWDIQESYNGKTALLQGIPRNAVVEDVERFLSGCDFDSSEIKFLMRPDFYEPIRIAVIRFTSRNAAMHAFRVKNRTFCLNNPVLIRVLE